MERSVREKKRGQMCGGAQSGAPGTTTKKSEETTIAFCLGRKCFSHRRCHPPHVDVSSLSPSIPRLSSIAMDPTEFPLTKPHSTSVLRRKKFSKEETRKEGSLAVEGLAARKARLKK